MRVDRYATYSALLGTATSLLYNRKVVPGLLLGFSVGTIVGGIENSRQNKKECDDKTLIKVLEEIPDEILAMNDRED